MNQFLTSLCLSKQNHIFNQISKNIEKELVKDYIAMMLILNW